MRRLFFTALLGLLFAATVALALEAPATIKKIDADQGAILVHAGGQDRTLKIAADVKVIGKDGKPLAAYKVQDAEGFNRLLSLQDR